jgi:hypothetical protein
MPSRFCHSPSTEIMIADTKSFSDCDIPDDDEKMLAVFFRSKDLRGTAGLWRRTGTATLQHRDIGLEPCHTCC